MAARVLLGCREVAGGGSVGAWRPEDKEQDGKSCKRNRPSRPAMGTALTEAGDSGICSVLVKGAMLVPCFFSIGTVGD